jgi:hypothetical protein
LRQRIIALVAAYAMACAGLIAGFGAVQAADAIQQGSVLCHSSIAAQPVPASDESNGKICVDFSCCTGCLSMAAAVPPPSSLIGPPQLAFKRLDLPAHSVHLADAKANAHRSRGPPPAL